MFDNKRDCYLELKEDFFNSECVLIIEDMKDGYLYINILLKLYLKTMKYGNRLLIHDNIPCNAETIATLTRHQVEMVKEALQVFQDLNLIEISEHGTVSVKDVQKYISIHEGS